MALLPAFTIVLFLLLTGLTPLQAESEDVPGIATAIRPDLTLELASGEAVLLAGILPPAIVLDSQEEAEPWQEQVLALLRRTTQDQPLRLSEVAIPEDRHGRRPAQVFLADNPETWLQGLLVREGLAVVQGAPARRAAQAELLALEAEARRAGRGLWRLPQLVPLSHEVAGSALGRWRLVEGRVQETAEVRGRGYINFGADWREDFTIYLEPERLAEFEEASGPLDRLQGRRLRIRGWLVSYNGPMIELSYPEQIEVLE